MNTPRGSGHDNAFGVFRLLFASLVIMSHVPELVDGHRGRELLTLATGTTSFGELAVDGFFVISGFLITASYVNGASTRSYLFKRLARIYPGFVAASLFCLLVVAPLAGASAGSASGVAARMLVLARPMADGAFANQHHADWATALNGAMWTIQYEFVCYLLAIAIGAAGLVRRPVLLATCAAACLALGRLLPEGWSAWPSQPTFLPGSTAALFRLVGMFLAGASFYAWRARLRFPPPLVAAAALGLAATIRVAPVADLGIAFFGGYLILAGAKLGGSTRLARVNNRNDISYGVYLYAWPIQRLLMRYLGVTDLPLLGALTWIAAIAFGWASWLLVERPALRWARGWLPRLEKGSVQHSASAAGPKRADRPAATGNGTGQGGSRG